MSPAEAIATAERALRRGSCSAHKIATEGCATCEVSEEAIRVLRALGTVESKARRLVEVSDWRFLATREQEGLMVVLDVVSLGGKP